MEKLGNMFFTRTLERFFECDDLASEEAQEMIVRMEKLVATNLDKMLAAISQSQGAHKAMLKKICRESIVGFGESEFADREDPEKPILHAVAEATEDDVTENDTEELFRRLHEPDAPLAEIIELLDAQKQRLRPEDIVNNALRLQGADATQLLELVEGTTEPIDLDALIVHLDKIADPEFKVPLLRYFGGITHERIPLIVARFLCDSSTLVVVEALKALERQTAPFDVSILLPLIETMNGIDLELALKVLEQQAATGLVPHLSSYLNTQSSELNDFFARLVVENADVDNFEKFLRRLKLEDEEQQQQAIAALQKYSDDRFSEVARALSNHKQDFIRNTAQQLVIKLIRDKDLGKVEEFALSDSWQVRERAIQSLAKSSNRKAIAILSKMVAKYPEDTVLALRAVKQLGFSKGLEICMQALESEQANVQRAALETIEQIINRKHASDVRDVILGRLPGLVEELRDFARTVISDMTRTHGLPDVKFDDMTTTASGQVDIVFDAEDRMTPKRKTSPLDQLKPGAIWMDRYLIKQEIGRGMMGRVMLVEDEMVEEVMVLKFMVPELLADEQSSERFRREVKYSRKVSHKNVIRVHDILLKDDICAISMEYFASRGLDKILRDLGSFTARDGLKIMYQIANGMAAAHERGVIHRDLKPSNILISISGQLKVVDFGIASATTQVESALTGPGSIIGSPAYMAPERATDVEADARSDIYSLGVIAYYLFSGKLPYVGNPMEVIEQHREGNALPITKVIDDASPEVSKLIVRMMAVDPGARPQTMVAVRDEIKALLEIVS